MERRAVVAEALGTGLLLYMIVGSGAAAERLSADAAITLITHAVVVAAALTALIWAFGAVSGAHFNPVVTVALWRSGAIGSRLVPAYLGAQVVGGLVGTVLANLSFAASPVATSVKDRLSLGTGVSEIVVTFVLVMLILVLVRTGHTVLVAPAVGAWVGAAIFGTSSTGFANPAVTIARTFTETYTGIAPGSVGGFVVAQIVGMVLAVLAVTVLVRVREEVA